MLHIHVNEHVNILTHLVITIGYTTIYCTVHTQRSISGILRPRTRAHSRAECLRAQAKRLAESMQCMRTYNHALTYYGQYQESRNQDPHLKAVRDLLGVRTPEGVFGGSAGLFRGVSHDPVAFKRRDKQNRS